MRSPSFVVWMLLASVLLLGEPTQAVAQDPHIQLPTTHPEWNVLYGHERFGEAADMLPNYVSKLLDASNTERSRVIASFADARDVEPLSGRDAGQTSCGVG